MNTRFAAPRGSVRHSKALFCDEVFRYLDKTREQLTRDLMARQNLGEGESFSRRRGCHCVKGTTVSFKSLKLVHNTVLVRQAGRHGLLIRVEIYMVNQAPFERQIIKAGI